MDTFLIKTEKTITRQEGDTAGISILVPTPPNGIDLDTYDATFVVVNSDGVEIIRKESFSSVPGITITDQTIDIPLYVDDTTTYAGEHRWELQLSNATPEVITIGRGDFIIIAQIITNP